MVYHSFKPLPQNSYSKWGEEELYRYEIWQMRLNQMTSLVIGQAEIMSKLRRCTKKHHFSDVPDTDA